MLEPIRRCPGSLSVRRFSHVAGRGAGGRPGRYGRLVLSRVSMGQAWLHRHRPRKWAGSAGPAGAADAVDIILGDQRQVVIDHLRQIVDIEAARSDVGGDENSTSPALNRFQRLEAGSLRTVAVDGVGGIFGLQAVDQFVAARLVFTKPAPGPSPDPCA